MVPELNGDVTSGYRGRFAPTPSGPLHFGSLVAALGSYLDARANHGKWFVRIEDIDPPREVAGAADDILRVLECFGFEWDGKVSYQSQHHQRYQSVLDDLQYAGLSYRCICSRKQIQHMGGVYNNQCRYLNLSTTDSSIRFINQSPVTQFVDQRLGVIKVANERQGEDFIIRRRDGFYAYHLGMVVDDIDLAITHVVRGADLVLPTACQIALYNGLQQPVPQYLDLPLALASGQQKLSKSHSAAALDSKQVLPSLYLVLQFMGQPLLALKDYDTPQALLSWAVAHWQPALLPLEDAIVS